MTFALTDTPDHAEDGVFDAETDDPSLAKPDLTWAEFSRALAELQPDPLKLTLLQVAVLSRGRVDQTINLAELADAVGRRRATVAGFLAKLAEHGWVVRDSAIASTNRAVVVFKTAKSIDG